MSAAEVQKFLYMCACLPQTLQQVPDVAGLIVINVVLIGCGVMAWRESR